jgi:hypothetical protein
MITLGQVNSVNGEGSLFNFPLDCAGASRMVIVSVAYKPDANQEISSVTYGGVAMTSLGFTQLETSIATEIFYLVSPIVGTSQVSVQLTSSAKTIVSAVALEGVDQMAPIYFKTNGVGRMVNEIPLVCQAQNGDMLIGMGVCSGISEAPIEVWQTSVWNVQQAVNLRSQGICSFPNFTATFTVSNTVDPATDWALNILGIKAA